MSPRLNDAIARAKAPPAASFAWSAPRAARVLSNVADRHATRVRRKRLARLAFAVAGASMLLVIASLRAASAPSSPSPSSDSLADHLSTSAAVIAHSEPLGDGGYVRD